MMILESGYQNFLRNTSDTDGQPRGQRAEIKSGINKKAPRFSLHITHMLGCIASPITTQNSSAGTDRRVQNSVKFHHHSENH